MRILVVEDDRLLNNTLCYNLDALKEFLGKPHIHHGKLIHND